MTTIDKAIVIINTFYSYSASPLILKRKGKYKSNLTKKTRKHFITPHIGICVYKHFNIILSHVYGRLQIVPPPTESSGTLWFENRLGYWHVEKSQFLVASGRV